MATTSVRRGGGVPGQVTAARVLVFIQAFFLLVGAALLAAVANRTGHTAAAGIAAAIDAIFGVTLVAAGVKMGGCESWTRTFVMWFEVLVLAIQVWSIIAGGVVGVLGIALAIAVLVLLATGPARSCFAH